MIETSKRMNNAETYYFAKKLAEIKAMNDNGKDVINLGIGSPDLPPHEKVIESVQYSLKEKDAHKYQPYKGISELTNAFAQWYKNHFNVQFQPDEEILPLIGSKEGIIHISMTFLNEGDEVLVPNPGYPSYSMATKLAGGTVVEFELKSELNFLPDLEEIEQRDLSKVKLMWINYPNMPTGGNADIMFYENLIHFARKHNILICHDNPYTFILNENICNIFQIEGSKDYALELTSLSKNYNMAGWRIGALAGNKHYISEVLRFKSNMDSGMFKPVQNAAVKALSLDKEWFQYLNRIYKDRKLKAIEILKAMNCSVFDNGAGMFVYAKVPDQYKSGEELSEYVLQNASVFITPCHIFGSNGHHYLRISLCGSQDLFGTALERIERLKFKL